METIHYFLKRYVEDLQKKPVSPADVERRVAEYEQRLRAELLKEAELAAMAERHRELAAEMKLTRTLLPLAGQGHGHAAPHTHV